MKKFSKVKYEEAVIKRVSDFETSFTAKPLERGFGHTIGNALRRVLLSSVPSVAPFAIKIKGIQHEFSTISNVYDSVVEIILAIKKIHFKYNADVFGDNDVIMVSLVSKKGEVRANQLVLPPGLELANPDQIITNTEKDKALVLEIFLRVSRGFVAFSKNKENINLFQSKIQSKIKSGQLIAVDSDFSPVEKVSYSIRQLNTISPDVEEELTVKVKTNGSITAKSAMSHAANILVGFLQTFVHSDTTTDIFTEGSGTDSVTKSLALSISALELSVRSYNSLKRAGIEKVADLAKMSGEQIANIKNLGKKSFEEVMGKLRDLGITHKGFISGG